MPRTKRKHKREQAGDYNATVPSTAPEFAPAVISGFGEGDRRGGYSTSRKPKRKRRRKARTAVSDSSSSSIVSESENDGECKGSILARQVPVRPKPQAYHEWERSDEGGKFGAQGKVELAALKVPDGDLEMEDAIDGNGIEGGNEGFLSPSSSLSPPPPVVSGSDSEADSDASGGKEENENEDEDEDEDEEEEEVKECSTAEDETRNPEFGEESRKIPPQLLHRDSNDLQIAQRFEDYYMQLATTEFGEELDQVRKAKDFNDRSLPMLVRALRMGVNVFKEQEKRAVVQSLGLGG